MGRSYHLYLVSYCIVYFQMSFAHQKRLVVMEQMRKCHLIEVKMDHIVREFNFAIVV